METKFQNLIFKRDYVEASGFNMRAARLWPLAEVRSDESGEIVAMLVAVESSDKTKKNPVHSTAMTVTKCEYEEFVKRGMVVGEYWEEKTGLFYSDDYVQIYRVDKAAGRNISPIEFWKGRTFTQSISFRESDLSSGSVALAMLAGYDFREGDEGAREYAVAAYVSPAAPHRAQGALKRFMARVMHLFENLFVFYVDEIELPGLLRDLGNAHLVWDVYDKYALGADARYEKAWAEAEARKQEDMERQARGEPVQAKASWVYTAGGIMPTKELLTLKSKAKALEELQLSVWIESQKA